MRKLNPAEAAELRLGLDKLCKDLKEEDGTFFQNLIVVIEFFSELLEEQQQEPSIGQLIEKKIDRLIDIKIEKIARRADDVLLKKVQDMFLRAVQGAELSLEPELLKPESKSSEPTPE